MAARPRSTSSKIAQTKLTDRGTATAPAPSPDFNSDRSKFSTYFAKAPVSGESTPVIYPADRLWTDVTLLLETAGPVVVGDSAQLLPVLSGKGMLLPTGVPLTFRVAKGVKLYVQATALNRIKVMVQPVPWLEQITGLLSIGRGLISR